MARPIGSYNRDLTQRLKQMAVLRVDAARCAYDLKVADAARFVLQLDPQDVDKLPDRPSFEQLLAAVARGNARLPSDENKAVERARRSVMARPDAPKSKTGAKRLQRAARMAGKLRLSELNGNRMSRLDPQMQTLCRAYRDRGRELEAEREAELMQHALESQKPWTPF